MLQRTWLIAVQPNFKTSSPSLSYPLTLCPQNPNGRTTLKKTHICYQYFHLLFSEVRGGGPSGDHRLWTMSRYTQKPHGKPMRTPVQAGDLSHQWLTQPGYCTCSYRSRWSISKSTILFEQHSISLQGFKSKSYIISGCYLYSLT